MYNIEKGNILNYMAENFQSNFDQRRGRLRSLRSELDSIINSSLDYFSRTPQTEDEDREQRNGMRRDLDKLRDRILDAYDALD